jgi:uncharacterized protein YndB with AHSA1/START domain
MGYQIFQWTSARLQKGEEILVERHFDAAPERVFDAWINPKLASKWLFRSPASTEKDFELDARVGGSWKVSDENDPTAYAAIGKYLAIEPPHRLVFTFAMPQFSPEHDRVTVEIAAEDDGSVLKLIEEGLSPGEERPFKNGWNGMFDDLAALLG